MTGRPLDTEQEIRDWLASSAPKQLPASLTETLDAVTSEAPDRGRLWSRRGGRTIRCAGRLGAVAAVIAIVASGAFLYVGGHPTSLRPGSAGSSESPASTLTAPKETMVSASPTTTALRQQVAKLPGTEWQLVTGSLPAPDLTSKGSLGLQLFALQSGGFVALSLTPSGDMRVFESADGVSWMELATLPAAGATVRDVTESDGILVAVGILERKGGSDTAMAWTLAGGPDWHATSLSPQDGSSATFVAFGPAGFVATGNGPNGFQEWRSTDGFGWDPVGRSGIPSDINQGTLLGNATSYVVAQLFQPRVWSSTDGIKWTETYDAPALSGLSSYFMGPIARAPDGSYRSFGGIYTGTGIASPLLGDTLLWTSSDMAHWTMNGSFKTPGWGAFASVVGGFVLAGTQPRTTPVDPGPMGVWTSGDGLTWETLPGLSSLPDSQVLAVAGDGRHVAIAFVDAQSQIELLVGSGLK